MPEICLLDRLGHRFADGLSDGQPLVLKMLSHLKNGNKSPSELLIIPCGVSAPQLSGAQSFQPHQSSGQPAKYDQQGQDIKDGSCSVFKGPFPAMGTS